MDAMCRMLWNPIGNNVQARVFRLTSHTWLALANITLDGSAADPALERILPVVIYSQRLLRVSRIL